MVTVCFWMPDTGIRYASKREQSNWFVHCIYNHSRRRPQWVQISAIGCAIENYEVAWWMLTLVTVTLGEFPNYIIIVRDEQNLERKKKRRKMCLVLELWRVFVLFRFFNIIWCVSFIIKVKLTELPCSSLLWRLTHLTNWPHWQCLFQICFVFAVTLCVWNWKCIVIHCFQFNP